jgi:hypothetical protein
MANYVTYYVNLQYNNPMGRNRQKLHGSDQ